MVTNQPFKPDINMNNDDYKKEAKQLFEKGLYLEAFELICKAIVENPRDIEAWIIQGNILLVLEKYEEAFEAASRALELDLKNVDAIFLNNNILYAFNRYQSASNAN